MGDKYSILVVDDEEGIRDTLCEMLEMHGFEAFQAENGQQALDVVKDRRIDAFLLDIQMPQMGGIELCRRLRAMERFKVTPIMFVTASGEDTNVTEAFAAGCDDFVEKPFNHLILRSRLRGRLERMKYFHQVERTRETLQRYLSVRTLQMVETAAKTGVIPSPEERDLAICFTDIRGFTAFSEDTASGQLFDILSSHLADQVTLVHQHRGYVDKFGGDGIMAIFDTDDMVLQSCLCALEIIEKGKRRTGSGSLPLGIGIHRGRATIGNIGSPEHLDYSVIGTAVNLAARLCGQAAPGSIAVSRAVHDAVAGDPRLRFHSERQVSIKGLKDPITVFSLNAS
jgi:class 3 adenylate cyclase